MVLVHGLVDTHDAYGTRLVAVLVNFINVDRKKNSPHGGVAGVCIVDVETGNEMISYLLRQVSRNFEVRGTIRNKCDGFGEGARFTVHCLQDIVAFLNLVGFKGQQQLMVIDISHHAGSCLIGGIDGNGGGIWREAKAFHHKCQFFSI